MTINLVAHSIQHNKIYRDTSTTRQLANQYNWALEEYTLEIENLETPLIDNRGSAPDTYRAIVIYNPIAYTTLIRNGLHIVSGMCHNSRKFIRNLYVEIDIYSNVSCQETERYKQAQIHLCKEPVPHGIEEVWAMNRETLENRLTNTTPRDYHISVHNGLLCSSRRADFSKHKKFVLKCPDVQYLGNFERLVAYLDYMYFGPNNPANYRVDAYARFESLPISQYRIFSWPYAEESIFNVVGGNPENVDVHYPANLVPYPNTTLRREIRNNAYDENGLGINPEEEALVVQGPVAATEHRDPIQHSVPTLPQQTVFMVEEVPFKPI